LTNHFRLWMVPILAVNFFHHHKITQSSSKILTFSLDLWHLQCQNKSIVLGSVTRRPSGNTRPEYQSGGPVSLSNYRSLHENAQCIASTWLYEFKLVSYSLLFFPDLLTPRNLLPPKSLLLSNHYFAHHDIIDMLVYNR